MADRDLQQAVAHLEAGRVVAYPTEAVFGLGCDPLQEAAVLALLDIKERPVEAGLIVIASDLAQLGGLVNLGDADALARAKATWPGPVTWVFPAHAQTPDWLTGGRGTLAVRVTGHPVARALCEAFGAGVVSTSANRRGGTPARTAHEVAELFGEAVDCIVPGETGGRESPSEIRDAATGEVLRHG